MAYARASADDKDKRGKYLRAAARRFLADLERKDAPFTFDADKACHACGFIETLPHVEGVWDSPEIVLHPAQVFFVVQLFGFRDANGGRRFTSALLSVARKAGKSTLAAAIMVYCMCCEPEPGAQLISAATTFDQTRPIWLTAKRMVEKEADLRRVFGVETYSRSIVRPSTAASFRAINAKASTQDGLNPSHTALDEIHAHKTADLLNVLTSAAGARNNPLWLYTTTEGYSNPGPWAEIRSFAHKLLDGVFEADHFLAVIFAIDDEDEEFDESKWVKANPLIDVNPHLLTALRKEAVEAKAMPSKMAEFRIKRLNRPTSVSRGWIDMLRWKACGGAVDLKALKTAPCWGGLDLASTRDIAAFRLVWRVDGKWLTWGRRWVPEDAVKQRTVRGSVPYAAWVESGHLEQTPGHATDYSVIEAAVEEAKQNFNLQMIAYDQWNAQDLVNRLTEKRVPMIQFVQGWKSYHPPMQELERAYVSGRLCHGNDPVLNWCASNVVANDNNPNMNLRPDKKRSAEKIDDICALLMAMGAAMAEQPSKDYQVFFV